MHDGDKKNFAMLIAGMYAYHRLPCSDALILMYWRGLQRWDFEQIETALNRLTEDAEAGKHLPKIGDFTRVLEGTATDRAALAWGKVHDAMGSVGAYQDVVFDDPAIHAAIEDLGGWVKFCRAELKEVSYLQHKFCEAHRAYTRLPSFDYPRKLGGAADGAAQYARWGLTAPKPVVVGDIEKARQVMRLGSSGGKTAITTEITALLASRSAQQRLTNDEKSHGKADTSVA